MTESAIPWNIIVGFLLSLVGGLIVFYLRSIKQFLDGMGARLDKQDNRIDASQAEVNRLARQFATCKIDSQREFVTAESFIKSESYTRKKLDKIAESFAALEGQLKVVEQLPKIVGQITREVVTQVNKKKEDIEHG